jgi:hypothetical protein
MITMTRHLAGIYGTRVRVGSVIPMGSLHGSARVWQQIPALAVFPENKGVSPTDNSIGVSEVECRPT